MGNACCGKRTEEKRTIVLLLVGLDNAGKTVAAKGLAGEPINDVVPTVGFHMVKLSYKDFIVKVYDLGGAANFRGIWHKYFVDAYGVIFVIDSSDFNRLDEAKEVLESVLSHEKVSGKPLLFLANKQDNENALDEIDLHEKFNLESIVNAYQCPTLVECCTAATSKKRILDSGIQRGFIWLMNYIDRNYEVLNIRVVADIEQQEELEKKLREEIVKRIAEAKRVEQDDENTIELYSEYTKKLQSASNNTHNGNCVKNLQKNDVSPPVYFGTKHIRPIERPKSAREFVKNQLQLNYNGISPKKRNKTMPVHLLGMDRPHTTSGRSKTCELPRRTLKSAGDVIASVQLPNMAFPTENAECDIQLKTFGKTCRFLPVDINPRVKIHNGISWNKSEDDNEISFINIS